MQQLSATDTVFLTQESERAPMHISFLLLYDPATAQGGLVHSRDILRTFESRLDKFPVFRRKLLQVPLGLDNSYWIEDDTFNPEAHIHHIALPQPGDWRQLSRQLARLHAGTLDRSRPLWEAYLIEGLDSIEWLPKGSFAIFLKMHHAAIDGVAGLQIISAIHDREPVPPPNKARRGKSPVSNASTEPPPSQSRLLVRAGVNNMRQSTRMVQAVGKMIPILSRARAAKKAQQSKPTPSQEQRQTRFGGTITAKRATDSCFFELEDIKAIKTAVPDATINDVVIAIISGAMRRYLLAKDDLPEASLVCGAPVSTRTDEDLTTGGNHVGMMSVTMCTDVDDPLQRLKQVHVETTSAKKYSQAVGTGSVLALSESIPPLLMALGIRTALQLQLLTDSSLPMNTTITNVPGSPVPLYLGGAKLAKTAAFAPVSNGMGLVHAILSHEDGLSISIAACREMLPDPAFYTECINASFRELQAATKMRAPAKRKPGARGKARKTTATINRIQ
jgi:WS/DGAT/MGAT family acyltransferase